MRKHIRTVSNLWKCSDHAHTRAKNRAVAEFQRLLSLSLSSLTNMRFLEDRMFALKTGQGRDKPAFLQWYERLLPLQKTDSALVVCDSNDESLLSTHET